MTQTDQTTEPMTPETNPCQREVSAEVPAEDVTREWNAAVIRIQQNATLPGFRKGKVPKTVVESKFADDIKNEVVDKLLPNALRQENERQQLAPISYPQIVELEVESGKPMRFKARFEVLPEFEVAGYDTISVTREKVAVSDDDLQGAIAKLRDQSSTFVLNEDATHGIVEHDYVTVSFTSTESGKNPITREDVTFEVGTDEAEKEFSEHLLGAKTGETREFTITFPADYKVPAMAGTTQEYKITVKTIKTKIVPELNDEWVKDLSQPGVETLEQLRERIRSVMTEQKQNEADRKAKEDVVKQLVEKFPVPAPQAMVTDMVKQRVEQWAQQMIQQGIPAKYLQSLDGKKIHEAQREGAIKEVQAGLILQKIAQVANVQVSDAELDAEIVKMAAQMQQTSEAIRKQFTDNNALENLRAQMRSERAVALLIHDAE